MNKRNRNSQALQGHSCGSLLGRDLLPTSPGRLYTALNSSHKQQTRRSPGSKGTASAIVLSSTGVNTGCYLLGVSQLQCTSSHGLSCGAH